MITEQKLYSFYKCNRYTNYFKESFPFLEEYTVYNKTIDKIFIYHLKNQSYSKLEPIAYSFMLKYFNEQEMESTYLPQQINKKINNYTLMLNSLFKVLNLQNKIPVFGPTIHYHSYRSVNMQIKNKALYRSLNGTYIAYYLSPYGTEFSAKNDPIPHIIYKSLNNFIYETFRESKELIIRVLYLENNEFSYIDVGECSQNAIKLLNNTLSTIKENETPIYSCKYKCKFKRMCKL